MLQGVRGVRYRNVLLDALWTKAGVLRVCVMWAFWDTRPPLLPCPRFFRTPRYNNPAAQRHIPHTVVYLLCNDEDDATQEFDATLLNVSTAPRSISHPRPAERVPKCKEEPPPPSQYHVGAKQTQQNTAVYFV